MPQMSPMWWTFLLLTFSSLLLITMMKMFFSLNLNFPLKNKPMKTKHNNWKW